jgi:hypothetical protein
MAEIAGVTAEALDLGIELFAEAGPVDAAGLESEVGFLEKVLGTALTPAVSTV